MTATSPRFGFTILDSDRDNVAQSNYQFGTRDREVLDSILAYLTEHHVHDGRATPLALNPAAPTVALDATTGHIPPSTKACYRYAFVDERGQEMAASDMAFAVTGFQIAAPTRFTVTAETGTGSLATGTYAYALSAYTGSNRNETPVSPSTTTTLSATGQVNIAGPPNVESSESGYNVYRRGPGDTDYYYLDSFTAGSLYVDDGTATVDPYHRRPTGNTTYASNSVLVTRTDTLPAGQTWKLYRTYDEFSWDNTLIYWGTDATYLDVGGQSTAGGPLVANSGSGSPEPIELTDAAHVTGVLPPGMNQFYIEHVFLHPAPVVAAQGEWPWFSPYEHAEVTSMRVWLGPDAVANNELSVQLWHLPASAATQPAGSVPWAEKTDELATIAAGETWTERLVFTPGLSIAQDEGLRVDIVDGSATTPPGAELFVAVTMIVASAHPTDQTTTHVWGT